MFQLLQTYSLASEPGFSYKEKVNKRFAIRRCWSVLNNHPYASTHKSKKEGRLYADFNRTLKQSKKQNNAIASVPMDVLLYPAA